MELRARIEFTKAIREKRLSLDSNCSNYVELYMYMGNLKYDYGYNEQDIDLFKHIDTREYIN